MIFKWWNINDICRDELNRYYVMAFFMANYGKEQLELKLLLEEHSKMQKRDDLLDIEIPIPKNEKIRNLVSLIVQNIIDKEKQIKIKNEIINSIIEKELVNTFTYFYKNA